MALDEQKLRDKLVNAVGEKADIIFQKVKDAYDSGVTGDELEKVLKKAMEDESLTAEADIIDISMMTRVEGV